MIIIDQDPRQIIPNVCERDIQNKVFLVNLSNEYLGIIVKNGSLYLHGGHINSNGYCTWSPCGSSLIKMLYNIWQQYESHLSITIYVLDNTIDLEQLIQNLPIKNSSIIEEARSMLAR